MRLDAALVKRGLVDTRSEASRLIEEGSVTVSGTFADKPSRLVSADEPIEVVVQRRFVSRGGEKLEHALDHFGIDVTGRSVLDAGVSTGGFTDCVLQRGAARVFAVDVGKNQLHERIKAHHAVTWRDGVNVRDLLYADLPFDCSLVVADLSFISLTKVVRALMGVLRPETGFPTPAMVLLVKPQFEAGRQVVSRGKGVVTDPDVHAQTCDVVAQALEELGGRVIGVVESPIKGAEGNTEFLMFVECPTSSLGLSA
jgi:23S rRNA (cytidine1920-2'-O)/16S rRNA (cytidine1409-2'-O)-methyltransferase